jgi:hypothetical protein
MLAKTVLWNAAGYKRVQGEESVSRGIHQHRRLQAYTFPASPSSRKWANQGA